MRPLGSSVDWAPTGAVVRTGYAEEGANPAQNALFLATDKAAFLAYMEVLWDQATIQLPSET